MDGKRRARWTARGIPPGRRRARDAAIVAVLALLTNMGVVLGAQAAGAPRIDKVSGAVEHELARRGVAAWASTFADAMDTGEPPAGLALSVTLDRVPPGVAERMRATGVTVHLLSERYQSAAVTAPDAAAVRALAGVDAVRRIDRAYGAVHGVGEATSQAPKALRVDGGQSNAGFGTADDQTVGILSGSFARTGNVRDRNTRPEACDSGTLSGSEPQDSGDLPATVELLADDFAAGNCPRSGPASDEGAAMAELVHDMAPQAALAFHTVGDFRVSFARAIDELCDQAGATAVVDDVIFFAESMYQRGPIAQAAEDCVARGTPYVSAAGNGADSALRRDFADLDPSNNVEAPRTSNDDPGDRASAVDDDDLHDWGGSEPGFVEVRLPAGARILAVLQWDQPALSLATNDANGPEIDLDLLLLDGPNASEGDLIEDGAGNPLSSFEDQAYEDAAAGADPTEIVSLENNDSSARTVYPAVDHWAGSRTTIPQSSSRDLEFRFVLFELSADATVQYVDDGGGDSTMYGHRTGEGVISVAAAPWWDTSEFDTTFGPTDAIDPEPFSALGGKLPIDFARDGAFIGTETRRQPRLTAVDGNNTTFFGRDLNVNAFGEPDTFPNFFGTSAAAPNAAAVVAGVQGYSAEPLAPSKVERLIRAEAIDITGQRAQTGADDVTGTGLIDAQATLDRFPTAVAEGPDAVNPGATDVALDGRASTAPGSIDTFAWRQTDGPSVTLSNADQAEASFDAPVRRTTLTFELVVVGESGLAHDDRMTVTAGEMLALSGNSNSGGGGGALSWLVAVLSLAAATSVTLARLQREDRPHYKRPTTCRTRLMPVVDLLDLTP